MPKPAPEARLRPLPLLLGAALVAFYARMDAVFGFGSQAGGGGGPQGPSLLHVAPYEHLFWLAHLVLAVPGMLLMAWGLAPRLGPPLVRSWRAVNTWRPGTWRLAGTAYFVLLVAVAVAGRAGVLLDRPVTDDESSVVFGARMIAAGTLSVPEPEPRGAYYLPFTYHRDGRVMAMDFPGGLFFAAAALVTGLGSLLYAGTAAATGLAVVYAAGLWAGARGRTLAALVWLVSPMALFLSMTEHSHLPSRALIAGAVALYARLVTAGERGAAPRTWDGAALGLAAGLAFCFRPFEASLLLAPAALHLLLQARREPRAWARPLAAAATLVVPLAAFAAYDAATTGRWYLQARFAPGVAEFTPWDSYPALDRAGFNLGFNLVLLAVFFLGLPGSLLVGAGITRRRPASVALAAGVGASLLLALAHDVTGIHTVGPIHYSESAVPLTLLAAFGGVRLFDALERLRLPRAGPAVLLAAYLVAALGLFDATHARSLRRQAENQDLPFAALEEAGVTDAVVLAQPPAVLSRVNPAVAREGSWVLHFPHPDPWLRDPVLFARPGTDPAALARRFPDRAVYRMHYNPGDPPVTLERLDRPGR